MHRPAATPVSLLSPEELTGRSNLHVRELAEPPCTLHPAVIPALHSMRSAAAADGLDLLPVSSFRDFDRQLRIWNGKFLGERPVLDADGHAIDIGALGHIERMRAILHWSALPGASRHHWGSDLDLVDGNVVAGGYRPALSREEYLPDGVFGRLNAWLDLHCGRFGFFRPYDAWRGGVQPEPWHLSFAAVAGPALAALSVDVLREALAEAAIEGRDAILAALPELHERYVLAVAAPASVAPASLAPDTLA
jgi:LAS superfamily LD-carboxypeptidase LdcB